MLLINTEQFLSITYREAEFTGQTGTKEGENPNPSVSTGTSACFVLLLS